MSFNQPLYIYENKECLVCTIITNIVFRDMNSQDKIVGFFGVLYNIDIFKGGSYWIVKNEKNKLCKK